VLTAALATRLAALGLVKYPPNGGGTGVPCYTDTAPAKETGSSFVVIYDRAGFPDLDESWYETPELQVIVRRGADGDSSDCKDLLNRIRRAVVRPYSDYSLPVTWAPNTSDAVTVTRAGSNDAGPVPLGPDQIGRLGWSTTIQLLVPTLEAAP
jgi:minor capsid protein